MSFDYSVLMYFRLCFEENRIRSSLLSQLPLNNKGPFVSDIPIKRINHPPSASILFASKSGALSTESAAT